MIEALPPYVSIVFFMTTLLTVWFLFTASGSESQNSMGRRVLTFTVPFWMLLTGYLSTTGFYRQVDVVPPRVVSVAVLPAILLIIVFFLFFRSFVNDFSLKFLTLLHVVRIPVEIVLLWLYQYGQVPRQMTFEGWNFDILSGITAPAVAWLAFKGGRVNRPLLVIWNLLALGLLANIVTIAVLSFRSPFQKIGLDQPNVGVTYLPFIWLPAIVVPVVLFAHLAALYQLLRMRPNDSATP